MVDTDKDGSNESTSESQHLNEPKDTVDRSSARRSRRSGRIARISSEHNDPSAVLNANITSGQMSSKSFKSKVSIGESKRKHMIAAEKLLKSSTQKENFWPLAGRLPFVTVGDLSPKVMKRLGRNAGVSIAPHVAYSSTHEVGQVCNAHIWRKRTNACRNFEELIYQARRLESFLDRQVSLEDQLIFYKLFLLIYCRLFILSREQQGGANHSF